MKPLVIIALTVGFAIVVILAMVVAIPYQEKAEEKKLAQQGLNELSKCEQISKQIVHNPFIDQSQNQMIVKLYEDCVEKVWDTYATDEDKQNRDELEQSYENEKRRAIQDCREEYIGQLDEMNRCIDIKTDFIDSALIYAKQNP